MATRNSHAKNWCFTLNNPDLDEEQVLERLSESTYCVFQLESGENGTPHFQGYVMFPHRVYFNHVKTLLPGAHFEVAKGTPKDNRKYCTKDEGRIGDFVESGHFPENGQGKRSDLDELHSALKAGLTQADYADNYFDVFIKYPRLVTEYRLSRIQARSQVDGVSVCLLYGPPRTGKSRLADILSRRYIGGVYRFSLKQWWDGYFGERVVIFDDFCGSSLSFGDFKRVFDRYPLRVPVKGSSCELAATRFFITSNRDPRSWWKDEVTQFDYAAIFGRITKVLWFFGENHFALYPSGYDFEKHFYDPTPVIAHAIIPPPQVQETLLQYPLEEEVLATLVSQI